VNSLLKQSLSVSIFGFTLLAVALSSQAKRELAPTTKTVDLVIALDVSGSMDGLIDSARQRLWDVVNELGRAQPQPKLRVALVTYGASDYDAQSGYVKVNQPFTTNLDLLNQQLFSLTTNGGTELVARAIHTSLEKLQWSAEDGVKIVFVAGNESAEQDPLYSLSQVSALAKQKGVVVNTLFCGSADDQIAQGWMSAAQMGGGMSASIDQHAAAVAAIATPMDTKLLEVNETLNQTYIAYGDKGRESRANQSAQDANAASMSAPNIASRVVAKASGLYRNAEWDLVDALEEGRKLSEIKDESLPEPMREMDAQERENFVEEKARKRAELKQEIAELDRERQDYISEQKAQQTESVNLGLDEALKDGIRKVAKEQGLAFEDSP